MAKFQKGHKFSKGRQKGSKNKRTDLFAICAEYGIDVFAELVKGAALEMDPDKRHQKMLDIAPYLYAKKKESTITLSAEEHISAAEELLEQPAVTQEAS